MNLLEPLGDFARILGSRSDDLGVTCTINRLSALEASASGMSGGLAA